MREFIHSDDLAVAIFQSLKFKRLNLKKIFKNKLPILNIGTNEEISIKNLAKLIKEYTNYRGKVFLIEIHLMELTERFLILERSKS